MLTDSADAQKESNPLEEPRQIGDLTWGFIEELAEVLNSEPHLVSEITEAEFGITNNRDAGRLLWSLLCSNVVSNYQELKQLYRVHRIPGRLTPHRLLQTQSPTAVPLEGQTLKSLLNRVAPQQDLFKIQRAFMELDTTHVQTLSSLKFGYGSRNINLFIRNAFTSYPNLTLETIGDWVAKDLGKPGLRVFFIDTPALRSLYDAASLPKASVNDIRTATNQAIDNYINWSLGKNNLRGPNGFFTWLRHGQDGRNRATQLNKAINDDNTFSGSTTLINDFLKNPNTRYHQHSLASFLIDELSKIENSPWSDVANYPDYKPYFPGH